MLSLNFKIYPGETIDRNTIKLSTLQQIQLALNGSAYLGMMQPEHYRGKVAIYIVHCQTHGYYLDLKHGYEPTYFSCSKCSAKTKHQMRENNRVERCRVFSFSNVGPSNSLFSLALRPTHQTNNLGAP